LAGEAAQARFLSGDLMAHVVRMSLAGSVGLIAVFIVDLVDLFFISLLGQKELAAAIGFAGAIIFFTTSVGIGLAIAQGALVAQAIGTGNLNRARCAAINVMVSGLLVTAFVAGAVFVFAPTLVRWVGATGQTAELTTRFLRFVAPSLPALFFMMGAGAILRAYGEATRAMKVTIVAAVVNAVLDPLLIFGLDMRLDGAAMASVIARCAGAGFGFWFVTQKIQAFSRFSFRLWIADLKPIFQLAGPAMLTNVATPISAAFVTRIIAEFGDGAVAGYAIIGRITPVAFGLCFALSGAVGPIIGQNYGAKQFDRVSDTLTAALKFSALYILAVSLVLFFLRSPIADLFHASDEARTLIYWFCGPLSLLFYFNSVLFTTNAVFNNLGRPLISTAVNWGRHTLGAIPPAMLGAALLGAPGVLLGQYLGGVLFAGLAVWRGYWLIAQRATPPDESPLVLSWRVPASPHSNWRS
jgi:putative MATE family efflux protein